MKKWISLLLAALLVLGGAGCQGAQAKTANPDAAVRFKDKVFEAKVKEILGIKEGSVTVKQALGMGELHLELNGDVPDNQKVHSIADVVNFPNLFNFSAHGNAISDLTPLAKVTGIQYLDLGGNPVSNLKPLAKLTELKEATLWYCRISELKPLASCAKLTLLDLKGNKIKDVSSLAGLTQLTWLDLSENKIGDASPLSGLTRLTVLRLNANPVDDWSVLTGIYPNLTEKDFTPDQLSSNFVVPFDDAVLEKRVRKAIGKAKGKITYGDVCSVRELNIAGDEKEKVTSISALSYFTNLNKLDAWTNGISDLTPLKGLKGLTILNLEGNPLHDLTPLSGAQSLKWMMISGDYMDLNGLSGLKDLGTLISKGGRISDISSLTGLTNLSELDLSYNQIADVSPLAGLTKLTSLRLTGNPFADCTAIKGILGNIRDLDFEPLYADGIPNTPIEIEEPSFEAALRRAMNIFDRPITQRDAYLTKTLELTNEKTEESAFSDLSPLKWFVNLTELNFNANPITDLTPLSGLTKLKSLNVAFSQVSDITPLKGLVNLESLNLRSCPVTDISALSGLTSLRWLDMGGCPVQDWSPLKGISGDLQLVKD